MARSGPLAGDVRISTLLVAARRKPRLAPGRILWLAIGLLLASSRGEAQEAGPVIATVEPAEIGVGGTITVTGSGFGVKRPKLTATLQLPTGKVARAGFKVLEWSDTRIVAQLKQARFGAIGSYALLVKVKGAQATLAEAVTLLGPSIADGSLALQPLAAGDTLAIPGSLFGDRKPKVKLGGKGLRVVAFRDSEIQVRLPKKMPAGFLDLTVRNKLGEAEAASSLEVAALDQLVLRTYSEILESNYADILELAGSLQAAVEALVAGPTPETLAAAKAAWLEARPYYQQSEIARFYGGPIDREPDGPEGAINAWPLDETHIDQVEGAPNAGIVNDPVTYPVIDEPTLRDANENPGETDIALGWHAIEFLLWGQDTSADGSGQRPHTDFLVGDEATAPNGDRRGAYLLVGTQALVADIGQVSAEWAPDAVNFRASFLAAAPGESLSKLLTGLGSLAVGELRGERILVPFRSKLQEDEHSCFSDTTQLDHLHDLIGIQNVWLGAYDSARGTRDVAGRGLRSLVASRDAALAGRITEILEGAIEVLGSPAAAPFDQAIQGADGTPGRLAYQQVLDLLARFNEEISQAARALRVPIDTGLGN